MKWLEKRLTDFEDEMVQEALKRTETDENDELILLRVKLEVRTLFMRLWQQIAASLFTSVSVATLTIGMTILLKIVFHI